MINTEPRLFLVMYQEAGQWWKWGWVRTRLLAKQRAKWLRDRGYEVVILPPVLPRRR